MDHLVDENNFRARREDALVGARVLYWSLWPHRSHGTYPPPSEEEHSARQALLAMEMAYEAPNFAADPQHSPDEIFDLSLVGFYEATAARVHQLEARRSQL